MEGCCQRSWALFCLDLLIAVVKASLLKSRCSDSLIKDPEERLVVESKSDCLQLTYPLTCLQQ